MDRQNRQEQIRENSRRPLKEERLRLFGDTGSLFSSARELSELKEAQRELEAEVSFRKTMERAIPCGLALVDASGRQTYVNEAFCRIVGWTRDELVGASAPFCYWPEEELTHIQEAFAQTLRGAACENGFELRFCRRNGERFDVLVLISPLRSGEEVTGWLASVSDITRRKAAERQVRIWNEDLETRVRERTAALEESKEQMEAFCYSVSHDLRAPLRAMQGFAKALVEDYSTVLDEEGRSYASRIEVAAKRMDQLVQDLLSYSQLDRQKLDMTSISLANLIHEITSQLAPEISARGASLSVPNTLPVVWANRTVLTQALINLLANALKFSSPNTAPRIEISTEEKGRKIRINIQDNGIGIDLADQAKIFRVFERLHPTESYPGTGVGLAIVKKGIERMGGRVGVESQPGAGSCFWLELKKPRSGN